MKLELHKFYRNNDGDLYRVTDTDSPHRHGNIRQPIVAVSLWDRRHSRNYTAEGYFGDNEDDVPRANLDPVPVRPGPEEIEKYNITPEEMSLAGFDSTPTGVTEMDVLKKAVEMSLLSAMHVQDDTLHATGSVSEVTDKICNFIVNEPSLSRCILGK